MYKIKNNTVLNDDKKILAFDNSEDAQHFINAASYMDNIEEANEGYVITSIKEFKSKYQTILKENSEDGEQEISKELEDKLYVGNFKL